MYNLYAGRNPEADAAKLTQVSHGADKAKGLKPVKMLTSYYL